MRRGWCDLCRGGADGDSLIKCATCPRRFHRECCGGGSWDAGAWTCVACCGDGATAEDERSAQAAKASARLVRKAHSEIRGRSANFYRAERVRLAPFVAPERLARLTDGGEHDGAAVVPRVGPRERFINAQLRDYQLDGVNWILAQVKGTATCVKGCSERCTQSVWLARCSELGASHCVLLSHPIQL